MAQSKEYEMDFGSLGMIRINVVGPTSSGSIDSTLKEPCIFCGERECEYSCDEFEESGGFTDHISLDDCNARSIHNANIDGLERTLLALACAGVDLSGPAVKDAIQTVLDAIGNAE